MTKRDEFLDDSALENALSDEDGFSSMNLADQLSRIDTAPPPDVPPREGLYSTPLSWERPQPGLRMDSLIGLHSPSLNEAEQRRLIAIAMNPGPSMGGLGSNINFNFGGITPGMPMTFGAGGGLGSTSTSQGTKPVSPPHPSGAQHRSGPPNLPRKQGSVSDKGKEKQKLGDRTAHNDIERKYRTNLKDKISELKDAVPALRTISENGGEEDETQPSRTAKVSKVCLPPILLLVRKDMTLTGARELSSPKQQSTYTSSNDETSRSYRSTGSFRGDYKLLSSF
jgi:hypothetical protein